MDGKKEVSSRVREYLREFRFGEYATFDLSHLRGDFVGRADICSCCIAPCPRLRDPCVWWRSAWRGSRAVWSHLHRNHGPRQGRTRRLLRTDRTGPRLRSRQHAHPRREGRRRIRADRQQDLDHEQPDRRRRRRVGQARRRHPRLPRRDAAWKGSRSRRSRARCRCARRSPARS